MGSNPIQITWFVGVMVTYQIVDLTPRVRFPYEPLYATRCNGNMPLNRQTVTSECDEDGES